MTALGIIAADPEPEDWETCDPPFVTILAVFDGGPEDGPTLLGSDPPNAGWLDWELEAASLGNLLGIESIPSWDWMLREGIAPGQEFLVRIPRPTYTRDYWGEHDVEYGDVEITWRQPTARPDLLWFAWLTDLDPGRIAIVMPCHKDALKSDRCWWCAWKHP